MGLYLKYKIKLFSPKWYKRPKSSYSHYTFLEGYNFAYFENCIGRYSIIPYGDKNVAQGYPRNILDSCAKTELEVRDRIINFVQGRIPNDWGKII